ncbi:hypothetical protein MMYC01_206567 [Madurella mycetomatis]|uniref:Thymidylate kinase n=1 Tax=Madurella mycetomatis TaxID=100816 RepID=A0A175VX66_9PEZI|nr:hypothetical protein MMYC01_206567 [Madurella mycetomatis]
MATVCRQPFAPLDGARLQSLTSIKNRQNAISNSPIKRKASEVLDADDFENVDPNVFSKRSKGVDLDNDLNKGFVKPSAFVLTKAAPPASCLPFEDVRRNQSSRLSSPRPRNILKPKSPAAQLSLKDAASPSLTAPAGRSPTRGAKRMGILSRRRTQRIDPPSFGLGATAPFSLDAALKGTIPSYSGSLRTSSRSSSSSISSSSDLLPQSDTKSSWFFDIHEDTPEQEMTNLLQHSTCTLDISSDEESERRASRDRAEGRDKENIPPADDISQTSARFVRAPADIDDMVVEKQRGPLAEMNVADYYAEGCDSTSVVIVPGDDEDTETVVDAAEAHPLPEEEPQPPAENGPDSQPSRFHLADVEAVSVDAIMGKDDRPANAAVLEPIEGTGESFELWESNSAKDECEAPLPAAPLAAEDVPQVVPVVVF